MTGTFRVSDKVMARPTVILWRGGEVASAASARGQVVLSDVTRILPGGRIIKIFGDPAILRIGPHAWILGNSLPSLMPD